MTGRCRADLDKTFLLEEIAEAHRWMEKIRTAGKLVVAVDETPLPGFSAARVSDF